MKTKPKLWWMAALLVAVPVGREVQAASEPGASQAASKRDWTLNVLVRYEAFSMDQDRAAEMRRGNPGDAKFYEDLVAALPKGEIRQEALMVIRAKNGQKAVTEARREMACPAEYAPTTGQAGGAGEVAQGFPVAISWKSIEAAGETLEVETIVSDDQSVISLRLAPWHSTFQDVRKWGTGASEVETPSMRTQGVNSSANLRPGVPTFWGTATPPTPDGAEPLNRRVWLVFVTTTIVKL